MWWDLCDMPERGKQRVNTFENNTTQMNKYIGKQIKIKKLFSSEIKVKTLLM